MSSRTKAPIASICPFGMLPRDHYVENPGKKGNVEREVQPPSNPIPADLLAEGNCTHKPRLCRQRNRLVSPCESDDNKAHYCKPLSTGLVCCAARDNQ